MKGRDGHFRCKKRPHPVPPETYLNSFGVPMPHTAQVVELGDVPREQREQRVERFLPDITVQNHDSYLPRGA